VQPNEVAGLLAYASALDPRVRRVEPEQRQAQVVAWSTLLHDVDPAAARDAIAAHYSRAGVDAVLPGDVRSGARGSETARHPAYRPLAESVAAADAAAGGSRMPALPAGAEARAAAEEARARLGEALDLLAAKRVIPPDSPTGYVPKRQRGPVRRDQVRRLPATDRSGRALTVCHRCAGDIPAPDGWDATDEDAPKLHCGRCRRELGMDS
jgi:hypothetical protein